MNEISIFGKTCRIELIIIALLVGFIAGGYMLCGCMRFKQEGFNTKQSLYKVSNDVSSLNGQQDSIAFFANNPSSPNCNSIWSTYGGKICPTEEQINLIRARGGNTTCIQ